MEFQNKPIENLANKKLFIFDMDGTIYLGSRVFDYAIRFIKNLRASGREVMFFTNNASRSVSTYVDRLNRMGFETCREEIMSSADVTAAYLKKHYAGKRVYLLGNSDLYGYMKEQGVLLAGENEDNVDVVVSSFDTEMTYQKVTAACRYLLKGAVFLSTHPDFVCPTESLPIPDSGAICAMLTAATGKTPKYLGKPYAETVEMIELVKGYDRSEMCIFGDRLYTDIALGAHNGMCAVLVMSGETVEEDLGGLAPEDAPEYIFPSLDEVDRAIFGE
ncbi:MAG: HAD-IIA family hydrolase [Clostridia bacterium]|nr:HAD-IIA family hydrolase [Clostridia bacterium]